MAIFSSPVDWAGLAAAGAAVGPPLEAWAAVGALAAAAGALVGGAVAGAGAPQAASNPVAAAARPAPRKTRRVEWCVNNEPAG
jgi:hypothetical protein